MGWWIPRSKKKIKIPQFSKHLLGLGATLEFEISKEATPASALDKPTP